MSICAPMCPTLTQSLVTLVTCNHIQRIPLGICNWGRSNVFPLLIMLISLSAGYHNKFYFNHNDSLLASNECKCTTGAQYGMARTDSGNELGDIPAQCGRWSNSNFDWCYLGGNMNARSCPGAVKSGSGDFYWTRHPSVCQGRTSILQYRVYCHTISDVLFFLS